MFKNLLQILVILLVVNFTVNAKGDQNSGSKIFYKGNGNNVIAGLSVAKVLSTSKGTNISLTNPYTNNSMNVYSGTFKGDLDGNEAFFYCIDIQKNLAYYTVNNPHTYTDSLTTPSKITYVLNNYFPFKAHPYSGSLSDINKEAAAIQAAIWHFSDGVNVNTVSDNTIKNRALAIIADANTNAGNVQPIATLIFQPQSQTLYNGEDATYTVLAYDNNANPVQGVTIQLSSTSGTLSTSSVVTDANGVGGPFKLSQGSGSSANLQASASVVIPQGTRYVHSVQMNNYQKLVLATPTIATSVAYASCIWVDLADLSLTKTVSNSTPQDGDQIVFTISVSNAGPSNATGIVVSEVLPSGLDFVSYNASHGSYDFNTGLWNLGSLSSGSSATLSVTVEVNVQNLTLTSLDLGVATGINLFVLNDLYQPSADTEGKVAVGRDAFLANYSVGDKLPSSNGTEDVLIVGRNLTYLSGAIMGGNVAYGNSTNLPIHQVSITDGTLRQDNPIDFSAASAYFTQLSNQLAGYAVNGHDTVTWGQLTLTGNNPYMNVFEVDGNDITNAHTFVINVPFGSVVIVNVNGSYVELSGALNINGAQLSNVLYNFYEADSIKIQNIDLRGSVLAPNTTVNFVSGVQNGQMIAKNVYGPGQFNNVLFIGNIPADTTIVNVAEIIAADQLDPNSTPGNGNPNEDDYASASIHVGGTNGGGNNNGGSNWTFAGSFPYCEIIWVLANDINGAILAGTLSGNIYRSEDNGQSWDNINNGLHVGSIWSLVVNSQGDIFVGTSLGVYKSVDNGSSWSQTTLSWKDVRSIAVDTNGDVYATVWGHGVYKSVDNGSTWTLTNSGLTNLNTNSIIINSNSDVFAGSFGGGVAKSTDGGTTWNEMSIGYDYVWALAVTSNNVLFAATYGNGLYRSTDNGSTWQNMNLGIMASYVYAITVDASDNIFVSTWAGGVYASNDLGNSWTSLGLNGYGVSSIVVNRHNSTVLAGTTNGTVYMKGNNTTSTEKENNLPVEFSIKQNYPNPFNPTTKIEFTVAKSEMITLTVYNILGQAVETLVNEVMEPGNYSINFDGTKLASGIYIYQFASQSYSSTKKMILQK